MESVQSLVDDTATIGSLVVERPELIPLFERLRLDFCCAGSRSLAESCAARGLDPHTVRELIEATDHGALPTAAPDGERDWREAGVGELCDHLVSVHHERLRGELPRIAEMLATVVRVHGDARPELALTKRTFAVLRAELETHLAEEERSLFPACRRLERDGGGLDLAEIDRHEAEHDGVGHRLAALRELTGGYDDAQALCASHRALLAALREFEADLHRHVHEENNVLFPRVRGLAAEPAAATGGSEGGVDGRP